MHNKMSIIFGLLCITLLIGVINSDKCGGNCPGGKCNSCPCGYDKNVVDGASWCNKYSGWNQACCRCIVSHESVGNGNAMNGNSNGSLDVGLFQINSMNWGQCNGGNAPCNLDQNLNCAKKIFGWGGNSFRLWATASMCGCKNASEFYKIFSKYKKTTK